MPEQSSQLDPETYVSFKFTKDAKFSKRGGCVTVEASKGETHLVPERHVEWLEEIKVGVRASDAVEVEPEEAAPVVDPTTGKAEEEEEETQVEVDDFTALHKIGDVIQEHLYEKEIYTYEQLKAFAETEEGRQWLIDQRGITEDNLARLQDSIVAALGG